MSSLDHPRVNFATLDSPFSGAWRKKEQRVHSSFLGSLGCFDGEFCGRDRARFGGFGGAQRGAVESQAVGGMHEAIEERVGDGRIWDQLMPMLDGDLAGDDRGASAVTVVDDVEQVATLLRG